MSARDLNRRGFATPQKRGAAGRDAPRAGGDRRKRRRRSKGQAGTAEATPHTASLQVLTPPTARRQLGGISSGGAESGAAAADMGAAPPPKPSKGSGRSTGPAPPGTSSKALNLDLDPDLDLSQGAPRRQPGAVEGAPLQAPRLRAEQAGAAASPSPVRHLGPEEIRALVSSKARRKLAARSLEQRRAEREARINAKDRYLDLASPQPVRAGSGLHEVKPWPADYLPPEYERYCHRLSTCDQAVRILCRNAHHCTLDQVTAYTAKTLRRSRTGVSSSATAPVSTTGGAFTEGDLAHLLFVWPEAYRCWRFSKHDPRLGCSRPHLGLAMPSAPGLHRLLDRQEAFRQRLIAIVRDGDGVVRSAALPELRDGSQSRQMPRPPATSPFISLGGTSRQERVKVASPVRKPSKLSTVVAAKLKQLRAKREMRAASSLRTAKSQDVHTLELLRERIRAIVMHFKRASRHILPFRTFESLLKDIGTVRMLELLAQTARHDDGSPMFKIVPSEVGNVLQFPQAKTTSVTLVLASLQAAIDTKQAAIDSEMAALVKPATASGTGL